MDSVLYSDMGGLEGTMGSGMYDIGYYDGGTLDGVSIGTSPLGASSPLDNYDWNYFADSGRTPYAPGASQAGWASSINDIFGGITNAIRGAGSVVGAYQQTTANNKAQPNATTTKAYLAKANLPLLLIGGFVVWKLMK
jgi:hypothetical protein